ncbi:ribonuclease P protein component [[Phormidium ambiguum] IAM M-71]|uniref:Ribonuclease P protein component n=1 Tax=[Phormidium ambiguum] IAM M-71 TaxID=454136 RepID=A0A1U7IIZ8_9CYAN|nr:ribonuclease P protein component [Phormidium ambiguum]OKH37156.1 ribonuclease P protein component [Phormidium ambiguum IAM M-71]
MALPKAHRLKNRQEFSALFRKGIRCTTPHLTLRALRQSAKPELGKQSTSRLSPPVATARGNEVAIAQAKLPSRLGISISQKVSKRAVVRNRIKRQLKAAFRQLLPKVAPGWLLVIVVKPEATQCDYHQFLQELEQLLVEAEVLNGHS